jgi:hypothetical protein
MQFRTQNYGTVIWNDLVSNNYILKKYLEMFGYLLIINVSARSCKFRCRVSPAVIFSARHLNFDRELIYLSLFLNYMRYKHETFTKMILKDGFILVPCNMSSLYLSNGSRWFRSWGVYDTLWSILLNRMLPHIHYTNTEILSSGPFLGTPHIFCEVLPSSLCGEYAPGNVFPWVV